MSVESPAGTAEQLVAEALAQLLDADPNQLTTFTVLATTEGWDSVNQMRVLVYLEREAGAPLDYERFMAAETLGDLAELVADAAGEGLS
ncbi:acyl carrier protein [Streptomyces sp. YIM 98790]|uniref:acyl carrier protein n=1 Tax=Streptomyces sp. YIM 98790 TaxID=2689077 RepID=UPI001409CE77|nr:acyl carrier protein [Streptomyces sp. YIM 98790]